MDTFNEYCANLFIKIISEEVNTDFDFEEWVHNIDYTYEQYIPLVSKEEEAISFLLNHDLIDEKEITNPITRMDIAVYKGIKDISDAIRPFVYNDPFFDVVNGKVFLSEVKLDMIINYIDSIKDDVSLTTVTRI